MAAEKINLGNEIALLDTIGTKLELLAEYIQQQAPRTVNRQLDILNQIQSNSIYADLSNILTSPEVGGS